MDVFDPDAHTAESRRAWARTAANYARLSQRLFGPAAETLVGFAGIRRGWRALDVACGAGIASRAAAAAAGPRGSVVATDLTPEMIEAAEALPAPARAAPIAWRVMDAEKPELPPASFDAAVCQLGLMLFARPDAALAGMARAVKPGGPVACLVQGRRHAMLFTAIFHDAMARRAPQLKAPPGAPTLFAFGPEGVLEAAFAAAGLTEIVTRRLTGTFRFASPEQYWDEFTQAAGRTGAMLRALAPEVLAKVRSDVLRRAGTFRAGKGKGVDIPYEFVMARGLTRSAK
ncbi:MAG: methyltransferase domain-containing protein [Elusimicrobia bacterium]|nr:methyltransferase domain-containing protein [Elusimicrobiota bacterium]